MDYGFLTDMFGVELRKTQIKAEKKFEKEVGKEFLPGHYSVLVLIQNNPSATQSAIANSAGLDRSSLVPLLKRFEKKGFITRRKATNDGRTKITEITKAGEKVIKLHQKTVEELEQVVIKHFGLKSYQHLVKQLKSLQEIL